MASPALPTATQKVADAQETDLIHLPVPISAGALQELPLKMRACLPPTATQKEAELQETAVAPSGMPSDVGGLHLLPSKVAAAPSPVGPTAMQNDAVGQEMDDG